MNKAWNIRCSNFPDTIQFDIPSKTTAISVSGESCSLNCAHCGGHYLKHMTHINSALNEVRKNGSKSCLVSGGCNSRGVVLFSEYITKIEELKKANCRINMHIGLANDEEINKAAKVADSVSFDFLVDDETIKEVYGIDRKGIDYINVYLKLRQKVKVLPHICIGLKGGEIRGEYAALERLKELGAEAMVFIIFIPTPGTKYADRKPPELSEIIKILTYARVEFPDISIHLGCMRPKGKLRAEIDYYAIECGVNKLVNPTGAAVKRAAELGLKLKYGEECCAL